MEFANLPEAFAERLVQRSIAQGVVRTVRNYRFPVSGLFIAVMDNYAPNFVSIPLRCSALNMSLPDAFPE